MKINSIGIAGLGLISGSIVKALKNFNPQLSISAFDHSEILDKAFTQKFIDKSFKHSSEILENDLIILVLPINSSLKLFEELFPKLNSN